MYRPNRLSVPACLSAILLAGCKGGGTKETVPGWVETKCAGVSIGLPPELIVIDLTSGVPADTVAKVKQQFPDQPKLIASIEQFVSLGKMKMVAVSSKPNKGGPREHFDLIVIDPPNGTTLDNVIDTTRSQVSSLGMPGSIKVEKRRVPAGDACYFEFDAGSATGTSFTSSYFILHGGKQYQFTFGSAIQQKDACISLGESAMKTVGFDH